MIHPSSTVLSREQARSAWLWATDQDITPTQRLVLLAYVGAALFEPEHAADGGDYAPILRLTNADIEIRTGLGRRAIQRARMALINWDILSVIQLGSRDGVLINWDIEAEW